MVSVNGIYNSNIVVYRVLVTGTWFRGIVHRQSLWLADMWHTYQAVGSKRSRRDYSKWCRRSSDLVIWQSVFLFFGTRSLVKS